MTPEEVAAYNQGVKDAAAAMAAHPMWANFILKLLKGN